MENSSSARKKLGVIIFLCAFFIILIFVIILFHQQIWKIFESVDTVREWVNSWGILSPLVFILLQIIQVVVFIIPGEIPQIAGGYLFGFFWGILLSTVGIAIGSAINFYLARFLGLPFVEALLPHKSLEKVRKLISGTRSALIYFIIFLIPGIPKDVIAYVAGISRIKFWVFITISSGGRLLGLILSVIIGVALADKNWLVAIITALCGIILIVIGIIYRDKLYTFLKRITEQPENNNL
ncbi:MAG: TVP38/TMEM64 family protein [Spirochaetales bacterium]|nr:TVP38/TMEM64 family protein [Spirochaetales bacterium]